MKIRALIVDDEPLARKRIRLLAQDEPDLECIGECSSGVDGSAGVLACEFPGRPARCRPFARARDNRP